jgi:transposase-like protein
MRLTHTGLPNAEQCAGHAEGWAHYLDRLAEVQPGATRARTHGTAAGAVVIGGKRLWLWRAIDCECEILDLLVQPRRDKTAALRLMRKLVRKQGYAPRVLVTDRLQSYSAARRQLGLSARYEQGCARTTALRTRIRWCDDASGRCSASNRPAPPSVSSRSRLRSATPLMFNVTTVSIR